MEINLIPKKSGNFLVMVLLFALILTTGSARPDLAAVNGFSGSAHPGVENSTGPLIADRQTSDEDVHWFRLLESFERHILKYYFGPLTDRMDLEAMDMTTQRIAARVSGYCLGQQLKYIQRGSKEHKHWLILERRFLGGCDLLAEQMGARLSLAPEEIARRKEELRSQFQLAAQGWIDPEMAVLTGITPGSAPNYFESPEYLDLFKTDDAFLESMLLGIWNLQHYTPSNNYESTSAWKFRFTRERSKYGYNLVINPEGNTSTDTYYYWKSMGGYMMWMVSFGKPWILFKRVNSDLFYGVILRKDEIAYIRDKDSLPLSMDSVMQNMPPRSYYSLRRKQAPQDR